MGLTEGTDYVFTDKATYVGKAGLGDACLLGTQKWMLMTPTKVDQYESAGSKIKITTMEFSLGGKGIVEGIQDILNTDDLTLETLNEFISVFAENTDAAELIDLEKALRIKVRSGLLSKGFYANEKEKGLGGWKGFPIKKKDDAETFMKFYMQSTKFV